MVPYLPFLDQLELTINSSNSFPHSSGIASSASAMSALALCLTGLEHSLFGTLGNPQEFLQKAAFLARLGSGSATRSVYGGYVVWGNTPAVTGSTDEAGIAWEPGKGNSMNEIRDAILVTSRGKKEVSSSHGHGLMDGHPWAEARYVQAEDNLERLLKAIRKENDEEIIGIIENEALSLHALMMSSRSGYRLMNEGTWSIIERIRQYRRSTGIFIAFTLDAGPNVHMLYKEKDREQVLTFLRQELLSFCDNGYWIDDSLGQGPTPLKEK
jgi:diphosphomevalonate decarboxylase